MSFRVSNATEKWRDTHREVDRLATEKAVREPVRKLDTYHSNFTINDHRVLALESIIANSNAKTAFYYCATFIKDRWPPGEAVIASTPETAYNYAEQIIHGRWPEGEASILTSFCCALAYENNIIKGRWPEFEDIIPENWQYAYGCAQKRSR